MATNQQLFKPSIPISPPCLAHSSPSSPSPFPPKPSNNSHFFGAAASHIQSHRVFVPALTRRLFLPSVSGLWDALTGGNSPRDAVIAVRRGMMLFRQFFDVLYAYTQLKGDVSGSLEEFDRAIKLDPRQKAYLWQRGLSLYYLDRFKEGAEQFRLDVAQNPNDTEESIWCFLCEAQIYGVDEARRRFLEVGRDPRPVMREAYDMFKDGGDPEKLAAEFSRGRDNEYFYAALYAGLYYESEQKPDSAKVHILAAAQSPYGLRSDDYMASLAKVHCLFRNWTTLN
ncbi:uncharacterized protein LOC127797247 isoform X2 [Diospyros lotus]|uniref:uncharacterized protein LOC127797247 isoform X2 n=1 Tax=Diospyros lotus TaxID=55363 RepID=UPI00225B0DFA|nr:uncharacterized protein LOC127797247 isoform X2 [Diospyros lotus]XP_052185962.1 uncharacterized protein LOC127797247 isoform X2 [Diospyros lotus]XP_052185967.1 uncharacterized protein LOC127797247 isoform X2 [Diospyros lotus]